MVRSLAVLALLLASCGMVGRLPSGGIAGVVTTGPMCPVLVQGSPCPDAPWSGTVRAVSSAGNVVKAQTDAQGRYRLPLANGTYEVGPVLEGGPSSASPMTVTVSDDAMQVLDLHVDSGIR